MTNIVDLLCQLHLDYSNSVDRQEELNNLKTDCESLKFEFQEAKKAHKRELDKLTNEKKEFVERLSTQKMEHIKDLESHFKSKNDKLKAQVTEKEEALDKANQDNTLLQSQLTLIEQRLTDTQNLRKVEE